MTVELSRGVRCTLKNLKARAAEAEKLFLAGQFEQAAIEYTAVRASGHEMLVAIERFKREAHATTNPEMENMQ